MNVPYNFHLCHARTHTHIHTHTLKIKVRWEGDFASTTSVNRLGHKYLLVPDWNSLVQRANSHQGHLVAAAQEQFAVSVTWECVCSIRSSLVTHPLCTTACVSMTRHVCECMSLDHHVTCRVATTSGWWWTSTWLTFPVAPATS